MKYVTIIFFITLIVFLSLSDNNKDEQYKKLSEEIEFVTEEITIVKKDGTRHNFIAEIADDDAKRNLGLMFRKEMANDRAMLFLFDKESIIHMWMKNTYIPLDMLFIDADGKVMHIKENAQPHSTDTISSIYKVKAVLELNAKTVENLSINPGDIVLYKILH
jgi:uncharacterized membrane protein (UPF0127 family)